MRKRNTLGKKPIGSRFFTTLALVSVGVYSNITYAESLSMPQAIQKTLSRHPELSAYKHRFNAADARVAQAGVGTSLSLNVEVENLLGNQQNTGLSGMQTSMSLSWLMEASRLEAGQKLAAARRDTMAMDKQVLMLDLAAQTARLYISMLSQQQKLKLAKLALSQAKQASAEIAKKVVAGKANNVDLLRSKAQISRYELEVEDLTHEVETRRAELAAQWQGEGEFALSGKLSWLPELPSRQDMLATIKNNPKLTQIARSRAQTRAQILLAQETATDPWSFSAGLRRNEEIDEFSMLAGVSIPLGGRDRKRNEISALRADELALQDQAEALRKRLEIRSLVQVHKLKHAQHVIEGLSEQTLPLLEQASDEAQTAYFSGKYSYSEWAQVRQEWISGQTDLIDAYTQLHLDNIELQRLLGVTVNEK